jgi:hypothetical protein
MHAVATIIGVFYIFAGIIALRAFSGELLMDRVLAALGSGPDENDGRRVRLLVTGSLLTLAAGLALATLSRWAPILFTANLLFQAGYIVWATRVLPPTDEAEAKGRQSTRNALHVYVLATAIVWTLAARGALVPWPLPTDWPAPAVELAVIGLFTGAAWTWHFRKAVGGL